MFLNETVDFQIIYTSVYRNNLKNRFLAVSAWQHILGLHSPLAIRQWWLAPDAKICAASLPKTDSSGYFGIPIII